MPGFYIKKLVCRGEGVKDALIEFSPVAHVVIGPSNTGKSYIFQCLRYMLGGSALPKKIKESYGYDQCFMEIVFHDSKEVKTISRSLLGGDANIYDCEFDSIENYEGEPKCYVVNRKATKKKDTLKSFFLKSSKMDGVRVRRNKTGDTEELSFSSVRNLAMVDEFTVIKEDSPILGSQYSEYTKDKSVFRFLLTGSDDSSILPKPKKSVIDNRKGRLEIIDALIKEYQEELNDDGPDSATIEDMEEQLQKLDFAILSENELLKGLYTEVKRYETTVDSHWREWKESESRLISVDELLSRLSLLEKHYNSDIDRLSAVHETGVLFSDFELGICPVCNSDMSNSGHESCSDEDVSNIVLAAETEINKIEILKRDLYRAKDDLLVERQELIGNIKEQRGLHFHAQEVVAAFVSENIKTSIERVDLLKDERRSKNNKLKMKNKIRDLFDQKESYGREIDPMDGDYDFEELKPSMAHDFCIKIKSLLNDWGYGDVKTVYFSEEDGDILINGDERKLAGKGYRALSYSAFVIGLMHYCFSSRKKHCGFTVIDSPLCTLRSRHISSGGEFGDVDVISDSTKESFYRSIAGYKGLGQIIILDNDGPIKPSDISIGYTEFTRDKEDGRYGFFPVK